MSSEAGEKDEGGTVAEGGQVQDESGVAAAVESVDITDPAGEATVPPTKEEQQAGEAEKEGADGETEADKGGRAAQEEQEEAAAETEATEEAAEKEEKMKDLEGAEGEATVAAAATKERTSESEPGPEGDANAPEATEGRSIKATEPVAEAAGEEASTSQSISPSAFSETPTDDGPADDGEETAPPHFATVEPLLEGQIQLKDVLAKRLSSMPPSPAHKQNYFSNSSPSAKSRELVASYGDGWMKLLDTEAGSHYYANADTGQTTWAVPEELVGQVTAEEIQEAEATHQKEKERLEKLQEGKMQEALSLVTVLTDRKRKATFQMERPAYVAPMSILSFIEAASNAEETGTPKIEETLETKVDGHAEIGEEVVDSGGEVDAEGVDVRVTEERTVQGEEELDSEEKETTPKPIKKYVYKPKGHSSSSLKGAVPPPRPHTVRGGVRSSPPSTPRNRVRPSPENAKVEAEGKTSRTSSDFLPAISLSVPASIKDAVDSKTLLKAGSIFRLFKARQGMARKQVPLEKVLSWQPTMVYKSLLMSSKKYNDKCLKLNKYIMGFMGDLSHSKTNGWLADTIVSYGQNLPAIRDEVFCQICKQTRSNPHLPSVLQGWKLMALCVATFPPSKTFEPYLLKYIIDNYDGSQYTSVRGQELVAALAPWCLWRLNRTLYDGPAKHPISLMDVDKMIMDGIPSHSVSFGCTLEYLMSLQAMEMKTDSLPALLPLLCESVKKLGGFETRGIFRIAAEKHQIANLKAQLERGDMNIRDNHCHVPADVLKHWLRELHEPLFPRHLYNECMAACDNTEAALAIVDILPAIYKHSLLYLLDFLAELGEHAEATAMDPENIAIVFCTDLLRPVTPHGPLDQLKFATKEKLFVRNLVTFWIKKRRGAIPPAGQPATAEQTEEGKTSAS